MDANEHMFMMKMRFMIIIVPMVLILLSPVMLPPLFSYCLLGLLIRQTLAFMLRSEQGFRTWFHGTTTLNQQEAPHSVLLLRCLFLLSSSTLIRYNLV